MDELKTLEQRCAERGMRMTEQRRVIARVLDQASDHPDVEELHRRAAAVDARISMSTVYRTVKLFEDLEIIARHDFGDGRARYETVPDEHHDHLIDLRTGRVIEFHSPEIEALQERIAREHGFKLVDHRLELYGIPLTRNDGRKADASQSAGADTVENGEASGSETARREKDKDDLGQG